MLKSAGGTIQLTGHREGAAFGDLGEPRRRRHDLGCDYPRRSVLMRRGEKRLVDLEPVRGTEANKHRPAVIVSNDGANNSAQRLGHGVVTPGSCVLKSSASYWQSRRAYRDCVATSRMASSTSPAR